MASFWDTLGAVAGGGIFSKNLRKKAGNFLFGSPEKHDRVSTLMDQQQPLFNQLQRATQGQGAGGAFGSAADFYYDILNNDPEMLQQLFDPEFRRFNQDIIPGLAEQFAGMGSGALSSSGFRNSATQAGTDLAERLAQMRMGLRQNAAQGLQNIGQAGLGNFSQDVMTQPGTSGFLAPFANTLGNVTGQVATGGMKNFMGRNSSPYG